MCVYIDRHSLHQFPFAPAAQLATQLATVIYLSQRSQPPSQIVFTISNGIDIPVSPEGLS